LGADTDPHQIRLADWERFIDLRTSGAIDSRGNPVPKAEQRPLRNRTVEADCNWLRWVFNWASKWRTSAGHYLMRENPVRGFKGPEKQKPMQPVATQDRYEAVRAVSDQVRMETRWGKRMRQRSHLTEILDIVNGTGRRISAVCKLTYEDLRLEEGPHGTIHWPAATDKMGRASTVPISPLVRRAIDRILRDRPGIGSAPLFPSPSDRAKPITRHLADKWLRKAEELANLAPQRGSLWHAYRRKWVTERKHHPDVDVAEAGGWKGAHTMKASYQHADADTMLRVVLEPGELREVSDAS
jgi:integrase